jgi:hypothetical protein
MKVITANPVVVYGKKINTTDYYLNIDGTNKTQVKQFQDWLDNNYPTWLKGGKLKRGAGYGTFGPSTKAAYTQYGAQWEATQGNAQSQGGTGQGTQNAITQATTPAPVTTQTPATDPNLASTDAKGKTNPGHFWDKAKGVWVKAKDAGLVDQATGWLSNLFGGSSQPSTSSNAPVNTNDPGPKPGMSKGMKIGLVVGGIAVLGIIIYAATRPKKGK